MRILLVEDEKDIADAIRLGLEDAHYQVDVAGDGQTGLRMAEALTDVRDSIQTNLDAKKGGSPRGNSTV